VALGLLGLAIGLLAGLATEYQGIIRFTEGRSASMVAVTSLQSISRAVAQSSSILGPSEASSGEPELSLEILDFGSPQRFEPSAWSPRRPSDLLRVNYRLEENRLIRETVTSTGKTSTEDMAQNMTGFSVSRPNLTTVVLSASIQESRRVETFTVRGHLWAR
jgi:hypothetical protein